MLKRICDRCAAEMPVEQTMDERELILRRLNGKPYDLCESCKYSLKKWAAAGVDVWLENKKMIGSERGAVKRYAGFNEEDSDDKRNGDYQ